MIKSVNDTNVWLSGIHWPHGAGQQIVRHWRQGHFQHFISADILYEIIRVLRAVLAYPDEKLYDWYWLLLAGSTFVTPRSSPFIVADDPDDNKFIACALEAQANYIVSEDKDLHRVGQYRSIQIVGKQSFLRILEAQHVDEGNES
jgi:putative PIN family toxin of toxin-antitoxin system